MDAIEALSRMLSKLNGDATRDFTVTVDEHVKNLDEVQERLRLRVRAMGDPKSHGDIFERIKTSVLACRAGVTLDFRQLRLACWGCTMTLQPDDYVLLTDGAAMKRLAQLVDAERGEPRAFGKLYGRLLRAYFGHSDASKKGEADREPLREFLAARADIARDLPFRPSWAQAMTEHPGLLDKHPGRQFADEMLAEKRTSINQVSEYLGLTGEAWLSAAVLREATRWRWRLTTTSSRRIYKRSCVPLKTSVSSHCGMKSLPGLLSATTDAKPQTSTRNFVNFRWLHGKIRGCR
jgi:hypothetical protein